MLRTGELSAVLNSPLDLVFDYTRCVRVEVLDQVVHERAVLHNHTCADSQFNGLMRKYEPTYRY